MKQLTTVGLDLAKDVIAACVLDVHGAVIERRVRRRGAFERWAAQLPSCKVAMEACGSAHHWGRWFAARGHTALLIAAEFVVPFRKGGKNDTADAEAIAIAARQPTMRFVPIKTVDQQAILAWHSVREGWKEQRTALLHRGRGLLGEYGVVIVRSSDRLLTALPELTEDARLPEAGRAMLLEAREQFAGHVRGEGEGRALFHRGAVCIELPEVAARAGAVIDEEDLGVRSVQQWRHGFERGRRHGEHLNEVFGGRRGAATIARIDREADVVRARIAVGHIQRTA